MAWRQGWRDWRAGELHLLVLAIMLAVAAVCSVAFLSDRLDQGLHRDAHQLLGGDAVLVSDQPTPEAMLTLAQAQGLKTVRMASFPSMARAPDDKGGESRLVALKAVQSAYPLKGRVKLRDGALEGLSAPAPGTVWVDPGVLDALGLMPGDTLWLGDHALQIAAVIEDEPDRGGGFMTFAPRVMMAWDDLDRTGLIQPASRVSYRLAVAAGEAGTAKVGEFVTQAQAIAGQQKLRGLRVETLDNGRPELRQTLDRASRFLNLVAMLSALMAAVVVAMAARSFAQRRLDACAISRVLGQTQTQMARALALQFAGVGLLASSLGAMLGFALHHGFVQILAGLIQVDLPAPSWRPLVAGLALGMSLLLGFGLAPVLQLSAVPPLRVLRRELGVVKKSSLLSLLLGVAGLAGILWMLAGQLKLGLLVMLGVASVVAVFALLSWVLILLMRRTSRATSSHGPRWWTLVRRQMVARPAVVVLQVSALAIGLLALALLVLLRTELISSWRASTPPDAPDRFVINILPEQADDFLARLGQQGVKDHDWYPMIRGRLLAVNGKQVQASDYAQERAQRLLEREFNLSHTAELPARNQIVAGRWQQDDAEGLSVEEGLARELGLSLGDRLRFDVAGQMVEGTITSLRKVDWASMRVNFFVIFPRSRMENLPATYIAAFRVPEGVRLDSVLSRQFPNITVVDVSRQIQQVQSVINQVIEAVQLLFLFALAVGLLVVVAVISGGREARSREYALMRALGASGRLLRQVQRAEMLFIGGLAGVLAGLGAMGMGWMLSRWVFEFNWELQLWFPLACAVTGGLLALSVGAWTLRHVLRRPVAQTLRESSV